MTATRPSAIELRMSVVAALNSLMADASLSDVSVKAICEAAHISRPTFYRHFQEKEDVPKWYLHHLCEQGTFRIGRTLNWHDGDMVSSAGMRSYANLFVNGKKDRNPGSMFAAEVDLFANHMLQTAVHYHGAEITGRLRAQAHAAALSRIDIVDRWGSEGFLLPLDTLVDYMSAVVPKELFDLLDTPSVYRRLV